MAGFFEDFTKIPTRLYTSQPEEDFIPLPLSPTPDQISSPSPDQISSPSHRHQQPRIKMREWSPFLGHEIAFGIQSEIDRLNSQNTHMLMLEVEARVKQQYEALLSSVYDSVARKLEEKDREIRKIGKSNLLLQEKVKILAADNQLWRGLAQSNEEAANSLRSDLELALAHGGGVDDAESCCGSNDPGRAGADGGDAAAESGRLWRWCRACGERESQVVLLPCKHLCLCAACRPSHRDCPACGLRVTADLRVNLSPSPS